MSQSTSNLFLIRPFNFFGNPETSVNNYFQSNDVDNERYDISNKALFEFDEFCIILRKNNLNIFLFDDTRKPKTPDSIFQIIGFQRIKMGVFLFILCLPKIEDWKEEMILLVF